MITEFFENTEIFVTGGSGVVGKALIEKLLRSCNVRKIYILLRPKKNVSIEERLEKVKKAMVFNRLKLEKPDELNKKLVAIPGDAILPFLGITAEYRNVLEKVSIVFHCAATVRFDEPLRDALKLNVGGTLETLKFAETLKHLKVFLHVSTFFSNPYLVRVDNKLYESPMDWRFCLNLVERNDISEEQLDVITRKLIVGFPNTYCFTKNLAESLVNDYKDKLPVGIYRPSIVLFSLDEPEPGFSPALTGAMGLFAVTAAGVLKTIYKSNDIRLDITPQDVGIKSLCYYTVQTADLYENQKNPYEIPIYISSSCTHSHLTFQEYIDIMEKYGFWADAALEKNFLIPSLHCTSNRFVYFMLVLLKHILPSLLVDFVLVLSGRKPFLMRAHRKIYNTLEVMKPFVFNNYESEGATDGHEMIAKLRGTEFNMDSLSGGNNYLINVGFCHSMVYSIRKHLFKEDPKTLPRSRQILQIKIFIYKIIQILFVFKLYEKFVQYMGYLNSESLWDKVHSARVCCEVKEQF
ncbi:putative fatty acyl-CoA reductase CG8306 [Calliphora vicina]|uniref:putative fatty acyl-CoA reductase CG8306 n=1 Tax=Calliphora vicina TaxID=7373 RepID=UPI00325B890F